MPWRVRVHDDRSLKTVTRFPTTTINIIIAILKSLSWSSKATNAAPPVSRIRTSGHRPALRVCHKQLTEKASTMQAKLFAFQQYGLMIPLQ
ncbi:hypothetical protein M378DRAFT_158538 [Amanita muscaria Koide BX008]|uniref:Uncharacterized protein n=1 Tax=Amanita muscaria (strain Koide BX008) TaxID=946122 RepID=A0A0C2X1P1_AMAMK|nr:hypothetical protein M378DRAFT_158538 [Amanita muscaria Koide BX008]